MMKEFLSFDKMITPSIIKIVWWVSSIISFIIGLIFIFEGASAMFGGGAIIFLGLMIILVGPFISRIYCELLIVFFKIYESLQELKKTNDKNGPNF